MRRAIIVLVLAGLAGCVTPSAETTDPEERLSVVAATEPAHLAEYGGCLAHNLFLQTEAEALAPYVPANWTFTSLADGRAMLRIFHAECDDGRALLVLSTPMFPDAASAEHHENPDVVIEVYTNDESAIPDWETTGAQVKLAEFLRTPFLPAGPDSRVVLADDKVALRFDPVMSPLPGSAYEWRAVYASGTDEIRWYWGDELSPTTFRAQYRVDLGPGTRLADADALPLGNGAIWPAIDLAYSRGLPPAEE